MALGGRGKSGGARVTYLYLPEHHILYLFLLFKKTDQANLSKSQRNQLGLLSEYLGLSRTVGKCPQLEQMVTASAFNETGAGGYGYNDTYIGAIPSEYLKPNRPANVPNPTRTLMFATTAFAVAGGIQEYASAAPPAWVDTNWRIRGSLQPSVHFRFNGNALIAWCDGHISTERRAGDTSTNFYGGDSDDSNIGFCGPTENNGWWNPRN